MRGFTLVEVIVTIFIFTVIFAALLMVLAGGRVSWYTGDVEIELHQEIRKALLTMDKELRQSRASVIDLPADNNYYASITFKVPEDVDGDGDVIDSDGDIEWSGNITYSFDVNNNRITRTITSGSSILANSISSLQFRRLSGNPDIIQIYINARKTTALGRILTDNIMSSIKMRN